MLMLHHSTNYSARMRTNTRSLAWCSRLVMNLESSWRPDINASISWSAGHCLLDPTHLSSRTAVGLHPPYLMNARNKHVPGTTNAACCSLVFRFDSFAFLHNSECEGIEKVETRCSPMQARWWRFLCTACLSCDFLIWSPVHSGPFHELFCPHENKHT